MSTAIARGAAVPDGSPPLAYGQLALLLLAQTGAWLAFTPLLQIVAPLKASSLDPTHKAALLSEVVLIGALVASGANIAAGMISDACRARPTYRRRLMLLGLGGVGVSYGLTATATTPLRLILAIAAFQLLFNLFYGLFSAQVVERIPDAQKGRALSVISLGGPMGTVLGLSLAAVLTGAGLYLALYAAVVVLTLPAVLRPGGRTRMAPSHPSTVTQQPASAAQDFAYAIAGRTAALTSYNLLQAYALLSLQARWTKLQVSFRDLQPGRVASALLIGVTLASLGSALACGQASDRIGRRKIFMTASLWTYALSIAGFGLATTAKDLLLSALGCGMGIGGYLAMDAAVIAELCASTRGLGRNLSLINVTNTAPQFLSPLIALLAVDRLRLGYSGLFVIAAILSLLGSGLLAAIRRVS